MLSPEDTIRRRAEVVARDTPEGAVLVDMRDGNCFELNRVGAAVWSLLELGTTLRAIGEALRARYEVAPDVIERDVLAVAADLLKAGLVERPRAETALR